MSSFLFVPRKVYLSIHSSYFDMLLFCLKQFKVDFLYISWAACSSRFAKSKQQLSDVQRMSSWFWQNLSFKDVVVIRRLSNRRSDLYQIIWPKPNHLGWVNPDMFIWMSHKNENASSNENLLLEGRAVIFKTVECHDLNRLDVWNRKSDGHSCGHSY